MLLALRGLASCAMLAGAQPRACVEASAARRGIFDAAIHVWSDGSDAYPWAATPPEPLRATATFDAYVTSARAAGVDGALIVQPATHMWDHSYVDAALKAHPDFFRGMALANPSLPPADAVRELERLRGAGYVGVRFNPAQFKDGIDSAVGRALYARAGELGMPVGVMAFGGLRTVLPALTALLDAHPDTPLIVDHAGFFRQPATGGLLGAAASNDEASFDALLALAARPQVHVKISALFRLSAELPPHADLEPRVQARALSPRRAHHHRVRRPCPLPRARQALLRAFGARRLMWGSDFPYVLTGGNDMTEAASTYAEAAAIPKRWAFVGDAEMALLRGGTAAALFGF